MKRAFAWAALTLLTVGCGGDTSPAKSPDAAAAPADTAPAEAPAPTESTPSAGTSAEAPADDAWAGESEAKTAKPAEASGKAETRTMEVIAAIVKENRKPVRDCFEKAKKDLPDLKGDMVIHFVVDPEGKVRKAELNQERSTLKSPAVVDCAVKVVRAIQFPASSRGMDTTVNYPFNLN